MTIRPVKFQLFRAGRRLEGHDERILFSFINL